ncbi:MAG: hypothetical protein M3O22_05925 [Pseudomonadota bacterium]|nr:hypothetical protein [Pseudomonadota bacterium]
MAKDTFQKIFSDIRCGTDRSKTLDDQAYDAVVTLTRKGSGNINYTLLGRGIATAIERNDPDTVNALVNLCGKEHGPVIRQGVAKGIWRLPPAKRPETVLRLWEKGTGQKSLLHTMLRTVARAMAGNHVRDGEWGPMALLHAYFDGSQDLLDSLADGTFDVGAEYIADDSLEKLIDLVIRVSMLRQKDYEFAAAPWQFEAEDPGRNLQLLVIGARKGALAMSSLCDLEDMDKTFMFLFDEPDAGSKPSPEVENSGR